MLSIDPSHFVALSFLIFVGILIAKRFFNVGAVLDEEINTIKVSIRDAAQDREKAYIHLREMGAKLESVEATVAEIIKKGHIARDTLMLTMRDEVVAEIAQRQALHALHGKHLEERFRKAYQAQLIAHILEKVKAHLKVQTSDSFHERQLAQSLRLLHSVKIAT